jgi:3-oxoacyl-[acyl-carrier protein] reductase
MNLDLDGTAAIVTGGNRGIGAAIAAALAEEGVDVMLVARDAVMLDKVAAELAATHGRRAMPHATDLRRPEAAQAAVDAALAAFGRLDIVINNAGATKRGHFLSLDDSDWADGFALKLHGYVRMARSAWPALRRSRGAIINIVGVGGRVAEAEFTIGGSVNAALLNLTKSLADLGRVEGVRVNAINPGRIHTERLDRNLDRIAAAGVMSREEAAQKLRAVTGIARFGRPEEIGWLAAYLASPRADFMQGAIVEIDGGEMHAV